MMLSFNEETAAIYSEFKSSEAANRDLKKGTEEKILIREGDKNKARYQFKKGMQG